MKKLGGMLIAAALALAACSKTDERINDAVKSRLANEPTPLAQLDVSTKGRIVRLDGVVATESERERVERIVRDMDDVLAVDNRLTVQRPVQTTGESR
jgi:osmotically-inducible protein OsmY